MKKKYDILAIDDEQVVLDSIVKLCSADDFKVDPVMDANKGLHNLKNNEYRLIICDIMMPEMDGFQFLSHIYKNRINTPAIITTGFSTVENAVNSLAQGAINFNNSSGNWRHNLVNHLVICNSMCTGISLYYFFIHIKKLNIFNRSNCL